MPASSPSTHIVLRAAAALAVGVLLLPLTLAGCATEPVACNKTDGCVCDENVADCALACTGKGCEFTCPKNKSCSFDCPEGGCKATGDSKKPTVAAMEEVRRGLVQYTDSIRDAVVEEPVAAE